jgi:iron complex transport system ATP-binding protein
MLRLANVSYAYSGVAALRDVSVAVEGGGSLIALAGQNGSGKSTLLKIAARVLTAGRGEVFFERRRIDEWSPREYAKFVGYLPQEIDVTFPMTALDVVVSGRAPFLGRFSWEAESDYAKAEEALALCDAAHLSARFLDEMSGGERKRVFLARVLAGAPKLILLDEPFAALDIAHVQQFSLLLRDIVNRTGSTVLFASHDLNWAAAYSERMIVMREGAVALDAAPAEVMRAEVVRELFGFEAETVTRDGRSWIVPRVSE